MGLWKRKQIDNRPRNESRFTIGKKCVTLARCDLFSFSLGVVVLTKE